MHEYLKCNRKEIELSFGITSIYQVLNIRQTYWLIFVILVFVLPKHLIQNRTST